MRFLQIHTFYPQYLESLYSRFRLLHRASFQEQVDVLISDAFSAVHMIAPYMSQAGYESRLVIANCNQAQFQWIKENGNYVLHSENWVEEIARKQVEEFEPDILYLSNPIDFNSKFIRTLNHKPKLILGWRAATFPYNIDWYGFDVMLSTLRPLLKQAAQRGAKHGELFTPGFPAFITERIKDIQPSKDIVFTGQYTPNQHAKRGYYLREIVKASKTKRYECALHLSGNLEHIPSDLKQHLANPVYGLEMHKALRKGRIAFDARADHFIVNPENNSKIDIGGKDTANMRIFEATGSGVFLLTEHFENLSKFFSIGEEIETFSDRKELVDKLGYFLAHPEKRQEIAARGQVRCLKDHSMERGVQELDRIIRKHLALKDTRKDDPSLYEKISPVSMISEYGSDILTEVQRAINNNDFSLALRITSELKGKKINARNIDYYRAKAFFGINQLQSAIEAAKEELRHYPDNPQAASFLNTLYSQNNIIIHNQKNLGEFEKIYSRISTYSMLGRDRLNSLFTIAKNCCEHDLPGNFVECGVAAGGSSALLAWVIKTYSKRPRFLYCFDTFEGMPDPTIEDSHANTPANDTGWGAGTCAAPMQSLIDICEKMGVAGIIRPAKGLFKHTLPEKSQEIGPIAFLHMDGDWYESTNDILENLYEQVIPQGYIQVDDYGHWDGCKKALHEYESKLGEKFDLNRIDSTGVWFRKPDSPADATMSRLLNLGCGKRHHPAWTNVDFKSDGPDVIAHDLSKGLPFSDESFEAIYHSHLLEHFSKNYAPVFLNDCFRVIKPGGFIRVVVPDLESIARLYLILLEKSVKGDAEARKRYDWIMLELFDQMVRNHSGGAMLEYWRQNPMPAEDFVIERLGSEVKDSIARIRSNPDSKNHLNGKFDYTLDPPKIAQFRLSGEIHQWMYDRYSLGKLLKAAGFEDIKVCKADESQIPDFNSYLLDIEPYGSVRKPDSLFMEAKKPCLSQSKVVENTLIEPFSSGIHENQLCAPKNDRGLKVLHLCTLDHGGAGAAALRLHLGLLGQGIDSKMLVLYARSGINEVYETPTKHGHQSQESWKYIYNHWLNVLREHPNRPDGLEFFTDISSDAILANHPLLKQADIVHLHWIPGLIDVQAMPELFDGKRIIWTLHDQNPFTGGCHFAGDCRKFESQCHSCPQLGSNVDEDLSFQQWNAKNLAYRNIDLEIVTPSQWLAQEAKRSALFSPRRISVIPYGLQLGIFQPRPSSNLREEHGLSDKDFVILFGAHAHTQRKGFEHLKALLEVIPPYLQGKRVVAVAFGHISKSLTNRVPILELGFVADPHKLAEFYSMADVYVLPAIEDNLPNTVLEALACGTPIVGFDIGGMPDMVNHGNNGWLTTLGDIDGLVQGIMWAKKFGANSREAIAADARQRFHDGLQAARYLALYQKNAYKLDDGACDAPGLPIPLCAPIHFSHFAYAKKSHFEAFRGLDTTLYGKPVNLAQCDLKRYQDLLVLSFITATIPQGAKILEVGGGNSRILVHLADRYECWNADKFEGLGNGPKTLPQSGYRIVQDYLGSNNPALPDNYFDLVFSISALEHTPTDQNLFQNILNDIHRVLKNGGTSLHLFDVVFKPEGFWTNQFLPYLFQNASPLFPMPDPEVMQNDPDLYVMSKAAYDNGWKKITGKSYEEFGRPTSINILWRKSSDSALADTSKSSSKFQKKHNVRSGPEILIPSALPTISIVTPSFNQGEFLDECIDSILGQGYPNLEYVIMDGGSTDGSVEIIKRYEKHLKYWQSRKDNGQYAAINEGLKRTSGEIMAWLNSDDYYHPNAFSTAGDIFNQYQDIQWISGRPNGLGSGGIWEKEYIPVWTREKLLNGEYFLPFLQQEGTFWKKDLWIKSGAYIDTRYDLAGDLELWARFSRHAPVHIVDTVLAAYRSHPDQKAKSQFAKYIREAEKIVLSEKKLKLTKLSVCGLPIRIDNHIECTSHGLQHQIQELPSKIEATYTLNLLKSCSDEKIYSLLEKRFSEIYKKYTQHSNTHSNNHSESKHLTKINNQHSEFPKISIITPSFNQSDYIEKTILSVLEQNYPNLEYIIIDGGSTDGSLDIIKKYSSRLSYWISEPDRGQSHAINKGLSKSTGDIFNWLNSDDSLEPGVLHAIADAWQKNPDAAAWVGACRRVTPYNQEINVIFPNNLSRSNMGENWNGRQFYQPACFMNTQLVKKAGGVNESLQFCMDLDLWLKIATKGNFIPCRGVWANATIHPDAKTQKDRAGMHLETAKLMISHGFPEGGKNRYESNFQNKMDRYIVPDELRSSVDIGELHNSIEANNCKGKKIAMLSDFMPRFDASSSQLRVSHIVKMLAACNYSIEYLYFVTDPKDDYYASEHRGDIRFCYLKSDPINIIQKLIHIHPDILWITNIWTTHYIQILKKIVPYLRENMPSMRIIFDTMDYHAKKYLRKYKASRNIEDLQTAQEFSEGEQFLYPLGNDIITVTEEEKNDIEQNIPNCPLVSVIPNVHIIKLQRNPFEPRNGLVFLGNFAVNHNYDAMEYFVSKIWPHIFARRKDIYLHVVGREANIKLANLGSSNIILHGYVKDLDTFLDKSRVFVCPMTYGAGMKGKIGSALSCGLPVVTTSIGAEGFPLEDGENCFIADDPEEFALKCLHLHDDPICWNNFSIKSRNVIEKQASIRTASQKLRDVLNIHKFSTSIF